VPLPLGLHLSPLGPSIIINGSYTNDQPCLYDVLDLFKSASGHGPFKCFMVLVLSCVLINSSLGFFSVLATKLPMDVPANCLANWLTCTSRFLMEDSVFLWFDRETCMNWVSVSSNLVVLSYKSGPWLEGLLLDFCWSHSQGGISNLGHDFERNFPPDCILEALLDGTLDSVDWSNNWPL